VGDDLTTAGAKCGEQTFQRPPQAAVLWVASDRGPCFDPSWKNQEAYCDCSLSVDHNGMAAHLTRSDCEGL
jgi:hypothetical protein